MVGKVIADRYELEELVGTGGMSSVFKARDRLLERSVALKLLHEQYTRDEDYIERFRREARAVAQLSHPNIVTVIDRGEDDGRQYIVFEYIDGLNLKEAIRRDGAMPVREALQLMLQVAEALAFAHKHGLIHRDVKPQNVLLNGDGRAKVTDFGIARSLDVNRGLTQTGTVLGTSEYIAPEQARGQPVNQQTDVYSLAVVLYELLTGDVPFTGENFVTIAMRHINEPPPSVAERRPDVPLRLDAAVQRALAKEPADRFASMDDFVTELRNVLAELGSGRDTDATMIVPAPAIRGRRPRRTRRRARWPIVLALLGLVAIAAVVAAVIATRGGGGGGGTPGGGTPVTRAIALAGVTAYDPDGTGGEHNAEAGNATDGNPATFWTTEHYRSPMENFKKGVGVVLDAGADVAPKRMVVTTDTPGYTAEIQTGDSANGPFHTISPAEVVSGTTTFELDGSRGRYFVVWITKLVGNGHVNEVKAFG